LFIGFQDTVENVGDVFLGHSVQLLSDGIRSLIAYALC